MGQEEGTRKYVWSPRLAWCLRNCRPRRLGFWSSRAFTGTQKPSKLWFADRAPRAVLAPSGTKKFISKVTFTGFLQALAHAASPYLIQSQRCTIFQPLSLLPSSHPLLSLNLFPSFESSDNAGPSWVFKDNILIPKPLSLSHPQSAFLQLSCPAHGFWGLGCGHLREAVTQSAPQSPITFMTNHQSSSNIKVVDLAYTYTKKI